MIWNNEIAGTGGDITNLFADYFLINLSCINLSLPQVFDTISKLKPKFSHGPDGYLLAKCVYTLSKLLHYFSFSSLSMPVFPAFWRNSFPIP